MGLEAGWYCTTAPPTCGNRPTQPQSRHCVIVYTPQEAQVLMHPPETFISSWVNEETDTFRGHDSSGRPRASEWALIGDARA
jgi:hypothetical protein